MKRIITTLSLIAVSISLFAQSFPPKDSLSAPLPEEMQALRTASSLASYGYKNESASALVEAAVIFNNTPRQELAVGEKSSQTREITSDSGISFEPKKLIADAKKMAGKDKELLAYINKVEKKIGRSTRGAIGGPFIKASMVLTLSNDQYYVEFAGGRKAIVTLEGTDASDLDLYVYDLNDNLICYDNDAASECQVSFTPRWDAYYVIYVVNNGLLPNPYLLCTN